MEKVRHEIFINAPVEKVWDSMLGQDTYRVWTKPFNPNGSDFRGSWEEGSKILFVGTDPETGKEGGMVSRIQKNRPHAYLSIEHYGILHDGVEDTESEEAKQWVPAYENYTFERKGEGTEVSIEADVPEEHLEMFNEAWPASLQILKELAEQ